MAVLSLVVDKIVAQTNNFDYISTKIYTMMIVLKLRFIRVTLNFNYFLS